MTESEIKEDPMFSFRNFLKPTAKNVFIWATAAKAACITAIGFSTALIMSNPGISITVIVLAIIFGGIAESVILFTREKPKDTLKEAIEDIVEEAKTIPQPDIQIVAQPDCQTHE